MGIGGTQEIAGIRITMTQAVHSGSIVDNGAIVYLGGAAGFVLRAPSTCRRSTSRATRVSSAT